MDGLKDILKAAEPHAILAWIACDSRLEYMRTRGDDKAELRARIGKLRKPRVLRKQSIRSYALWLLEHTPWLPTGATGLQEPARCVISDALSADLRALLPQPVIQSDHAIFASLGIDLPKVRFALTCVGVRNGLGEISWDDCYMLLLELPQRDPEGRCARALYRALVTRSDIDGALASGRRSEFLHSGKLWCRHGGAGYYAPVRELLYLDTGVVPDQLRQHVPLLELDSRRGAERVERLFGVKPLDNRTLSWSITSHTPSLRTVQLQQELEELKPFITALCLHAGADFADLERMQRLEVKLCSSATGVARVRNTEFPVELREPGAALYDKEETAYIIADPAPDGRLLADGLVAAALGDVLAEVLGKAQQDTFSLLAGCPPAQCKALLGRHLGATPAEVDQLLSRAGHTRDIAPTELSDRAAPDPVYIAPPARGVAIQERIVPAPDVAPQAPMSSRTGPVGPVVVQATAFAPRGPAQPIQLRVRRTPSGSLTSGRQVTDASRSQDLAKRFEEAQGRYPLLVDHLQGTAAPGCDVLSFSSREERDRFRDQPERDWSTVERFIEVKGRGSMHGVVVLGSNELDAARRWRCKYYVYRVFERERGEFDVRVVPDPVDAGTPMIQIDMSHAAAVECWIASEVQGTSE